MLLVLLEGLRAQRARRPPLGRLRAMTVFRFRFRFAGDASFVAPCRLPASMGRFVHAPTGVQ